MALEKYIAFKRVGSGRTFFAERITTQFDHGCRIVGMTGFMLEGNEQVKTWISADELHKSDKWIYAGGRVYEG